MWMLSSKVMPYLLRLAAPLINSSIVHSKFWKYPAVQSIRFKTDNVLAPQWACFSLKSTFFNEFTLKVSSWYFQSAKMFHTRHNYVKKNPLLVGCKNLEIKYLSYKKNVFLTPIITNFILHWLSLWISRSQLSLMCLKVIKNCTFRPLARHQ